MDLKQTRAHDVLPVYPLFDSDLPVHANDPNLLAIVVQPLYFGGMGRRLAATTRIYPYRWKVRQLPCTRTTHSTCSTSLLSVSSVHFKKFRDLCTTISFCWKQLVNRHNIAGDDDSINVVAIEHNISK